MKASTAAVSKGVLSMGVFLESGTPGRAGLDWSNVKCQAMPACTATRVAPERKETWSFAKIWLR